MAILPAVGFNEIWDENLGGEADSTTWDKYSSTVPVGETWILQSVSIHNYSDAGGVTLIRIPRVSGADVTLGYVVSRLILEPLVANGEWLLGPGDKVRVYMTGIDIGDIIGAGVVGYKMHLPM